MRCFLVILIFSWSCSLARAQLVQDGKLQPTVLMMMANPMPAYEGSSVDNEENVLKSGASSIIQHFRPSPQLYVVPEVEVQPLGQYGIPQTTLATYGVPMGVVGNVPTESSVYHESYGVPTKNSPTPVVVNGWSNGQGWSNKERSLSAELTRLLLSLPGLKLSLLQPVVVGLGEAGASVTKTSAHISHGVAKGLPQVTHATAHLLNNLVLASGAKSEVLFNTLATLGYAAAGAKTAINAQLPHTFAVAKDASAHIASSVSHAVENIALTKRRLVSNGHDALRANKQAIHNSIRTGTHQVKPNVVLEVTESYPASSHSTFRTDEGSGYGWTTTH